MKKVIYLWITLQILKAKMEVFFYCMNYEYECEVVLQTSDFHVIWI